MNPLIFNKVCIPLCEGREMLASGLYDQLLKQWPQINHKTTVSYIKDYPSSVTLPVQFNPVTKSAIRRKPGAMPRLWRVLFELTALRRFSRMGWYSVLYKAVEVTKLTYPITHIGINYSPELFGGRPILHKEEYPSIRFSGFYEPQGDSLFWKRPENLDPSADITRPSRFEAPNPKTRRPYSFPLTVDEARDMFRLNIDPPQNDQQPHEPDAPPEG